MSSPTYRVRPNTVDPIAMPGTTLTTITLGGLTFQQQTVPYIQPLPTAQGIFIQNRTIVPLYFTFDSETEAGIFGLIVEPGDDYTLNTGIGMIRANIVSLADTSQARLPILGTSMDVGGSREALLMANGQGQFSLGVLLITCSSTPLDITRETASPYIRRNWLTQTVAAGVGTYTATYASVLSTAGIAAAGVFSRFWVQNPSGASTFTVKIAPGPNAQETILATLTVPVSTPLTAFDYQFGFVSVTWTVAGQLIILDQEVIAAPGA